VIIQRRPCAFLCLLMKKQKNTWGVLAGWESARRLVCGELLLLVIFLIQMQDARGRWELYVNKHPEISIFVFSNICFWSFRKLRFSLGFGYFYGNIILLAGFHLCRIYVIGNNTPHWLAWYKNGSPDGERK